MIISTDCGLSSNSPPTGEKAFRLTERQMEEETQRQGGLDREVRVLRWRAPRARSLRFPGCDGRPGQPDGDVAPTDQGSLVGRPVSDAVFRLVFRMDSRLHPSSLVWVPLNPKLDLCNNAAPRNGVPGLDLATEFGIRDPQLEDRNQSAAGSLAEGLDETLTLHRLGGYGVLGRSLKTTNGLESINALIEERCAKVDHWQHSSQRHRWLATALLDIAPRLRKVMGYRHLPRLRDALKRELKIDTTTSTKKVA